MKKNENIDSLRNSILHNIIPQKYGHKFFAQKHFSNEDGRTSWALSRLRQSPCYDGVGWCSFSMCLFWL